MKALVFFAGVMMAGASFANCGNDKAVGVDCTVAPGTVMTTTAQAAAQQTQTQAQIANGGAGGAGGAGGIGLGGAGYGGSVANAGNSAVNNQLGFSNTTNYTMKLPPSMAFAPSISPTATCAIPLSAGLSVISFGGSFGTAYVDANCALLEQARMVAILGDGETANQMLCAIPTYAAAREALNRPCVPMTVVKKK